MFCVWKVSPALAAKGSARFWSALSLRQISDSFQQFGEAQNSPRQKLSSGLVYSWDPCSAVACWGPRCCQWLKVPSQAAEAECSNRCWLCRCIAFRDERQDCPSVSYFSITPKEGEDPLEKALLQTLKMHFSVSVEKELSFCSVLFSACHWCLEVAT